jgi:hypothetical protein
MHSDHDLHKIVEGVKDGGGKPVVVPYARVIYKDGELKVTIIVIDDMTEHHVIIGMDVSSDLEDILDNLEWDNEDY